MAHDTAHSRSESRSLLTLPDLGREKFLDLLALTSQLKLEMKQRDKLDYLAGKLIALLFETPSTRTRVSFEAASLRMGADVMYLQSDRLKIAGGEPADDTGRVLSGYCDCLVARVWPHDTLVRLASRSTVPVINACTDVDHPTQALCDLFTVQEALGPLNGLKMVFVGTGNNMCNALMFGGALAGMSLTIACPAGLEPAEDVLMTAQRLALESGGSVRIDHDPAEAIRNADVVYTDIWEVPGREDLDITEVNVDWSRYRVDRSLLALAPEGIRVMHCGDALRGKEITDEVMTGPESLIWDQADNKLFGGAAVLFYALTGETLLPTPR